jgi:hypothetical protein
MRRKPFLLEVRDLWPEFGISMGVLKNPLIIALSRWLENFLYARATHIWSTRLRIASICLPKVCLKTK